MTWTVDATQYRYERGGIRHHFTWDNGTRALPVTAPSPPVPVAAAPLQDIQGNTVAPYLWDSEGNPIRQQCVLVQMHAPIGEMTVSFDYERVGDFPILPTPLRPNPYGSSPGLDPNLVFRKGWMDVDGPATEIDGDRYKTRVTGEFQYDCLQPIWFQDGLPIPGTSYDALAPAGLDQSFFRATWWTPAADVNGGQWTPQGDGALLRQDNSNLGFPDPQPPADDDAIPGQNA